MPASQSLAELQLSSVEIRPSKVPCDNASGTFGHGVTLAIPCAKPMRQETPAPPGLRIFSPLKSSSERTSFLVVYQFSLPSSSQLPSTCDRNLVSSCLLMCSPGAPSE